MTGRQFKTLNINMFLPLGLFTEHCGIRGHSAVQGRNVVTNRMAGRWKVVGWSIIGPRYRLWALAAKATDTVALAAMPREPRKLAIKFGVATLTHYRGIYLLSSIRIADRAQRHAGHSDSSDSTKQPLPYPIILGLGRIEITRLLRRNGMFQYLTSLPKYPDSTSHRRFLPWR